MERSTFALFHMCISAADVVKGGATCLYSCWIEMADVLRGVCCLCKTFDIPAIHAQADGQDTHRVAIDMMIAASVAHYRYRQQMKQEAFESNTKLYTAGSFTGGVLQARTIMECTANSSLTNVCFLNWFQHNVTNSDYFGCRVQGVQAGRNFFEESFDYQRPYNAVVQNATNHIRPAKLYSKEWNTQFREDMKSGHSSVKRTHNIVMQTSKSAGANISHFPNYHISRCHDLCDSDRVSSASSQDESTWIVQQLAGMTPLSTQVCRRMMGTQTLDPALVSQCSELLKSNNNEVDKPSESADVFGGTIPIVGNNDTHNGHAAIDTKPSQPWARDEALFCGWNCFMPGHEPWAAAV